MKIEKLTDDKIRVIINSQDTHFNQEDFFKNPIDTQDIFLDILEKAEEEVNFHTDGCKLLIEAFSTFEDTIVFTITKFSVTENKLTSSSNKKRVIAKRRNNVPILNNATYKFDNFDSFCYFCKSISNILDVHIEKIAKKVLLYKYQENFYLILKDINYSNKKIYKVFNNLTEFAEIQNFSKNFEFKLSEHGKIFIKNNAISKGIKYLI